VSEPVDEKRDQGAAAIQGSCFAPHKIVLFRIPSPLWMAGLDVNAAQPLISIHEECRVDVSCQSFPACIGQR